MVKRKRKPMGEQNDEEVTGEEAVESEVLSREEGIPGTPEEEPAVADPGPALHDIEFVARAAARGEFGNPQARRLRLQQAGYDPNEVQREIIRQANQ